MNFCQALASRLNETFGPDTFTAAPSLSPSARRALKAYGEEACRTAYRIARETGEGSRTIAFSYPLPCPPGCTIVRTTRQVDAAINAGRELAEGRK